MQLESQYDKLFTEDGLSKDAEIGGPGAVIRLENAEGNQTTVPKLNLSIIYMHQNANSKPIAPGEQQPSYEDDDQTDTDHNGGGFQVKTNKSA